MLFSYNPQSQVVIYVLGWFLISIAPSTTLIVTEIIQLQQDSIWLANLPLADGTHMLLVSPWIPYIIINLVIAILLLWLSIRLVNQSPG